MAKIDVKVPDIGDFKDVPVIEVLVKPGDVVKVDQSLITLESDKATMDVPSPVAGTVAEVVAKVGDKVSMGTLIARLESAEGKKVEASGAPAKAAAAPPSAPEKAAAAPAAKAAAASPPAKTAPIDVTIPDIGDFKDVPVIEILVKAGDTVEAEQPIVTLESDKATMDVPSPAAGKITQIVVKVGDKVSMGSVIAKLDAGGSAADRLGPGGRGGGEGRGGRRRGARNLARCAERFAAEADQGRRRPGHCRFLRRVRRASRSQAGARTRSRSQPYQGDGREGPHHPGRRQGGARG